MEGVQGGKAASQSLMSPPAGKLSRPPRPERAYGPDRHVSLEAHGLINPPGGLLALKVAPCEERGCLLCGCRRYQTLHPLRATSGAWIAGGLFLGSEELPDRDKDIPGVI
ncbi:hypothetical protein NDU88_003108 [Pleurodeles waltl]|uniref:Uncharacterized protein n=1 Tax=Pleurodeles waltl TaxID=8319 RepID=A0AAV7MXK2_PLEWA|nr:hypothetical protein NDU88_003108 [Pleurodeles waltl]